MRPVFSYQEMLAYLNQAAPFDAQYLKKQDIHHQFDSKREITMQEIRSLEREQDIDTFVREEEKELLECFFTNGFLEAPEPTEEEVEYITQLLYGIILGNYSFKEPTEQEVEEVIQILHNPDQIQRYDREEMNLLSCAWKMAHITREEYDSDYLIDLASILTEKQYLRQFLFIYIGCTVGHVLLSPELSYLLVSLTGDTLVLSNLLYLLHMLNKEDKEFLGKSQEVTKLLKSHYVYMLLPAYCSSWFLSLVCYGMNYITGKRIRETEEFRKLIKRS